MTNNSLKIAVLGCVLACLFCFSGAFAKEQPAESAPEAFKSTPYPVPRFVSLHADEVYARTGPGLRYPIKWVYKRNALPVEIILEYEVWRKIRDSDGETGWVHQSLLTGKRTGLVTGEGLVPLFQKPQMEAKLAARIEPKTIVDLEECQKDWCRISAYGYPGWLERKYIWGIYDQENFD